MSPPANRRESGMSTFERYLTLWVALCIVAGVLLGNLFPGLFQLVARWEYASVNLVVAVLIWAMVYPMMVAVDFASLRHIHKRPKGLVITVARGDGRAGVRPDEGLAGSRPVQHARPHVLPR